ncbi:Hypothetical protein LOCK900_0310 [Lacticaseibacillus rhamnosus LOCK900]|uniref:Uncharacterized protein n=1 Tax=Lacticaseibacillus rhamnosus LRHMDP3 TaxID=1203259 RepID=A0AB33XS41_LACRH|nr:Hypothetical protein LOCK900_0310 [Lacticaseibacillus rhamnosus LOCK900]ASY49268.1 hypothetical protein N507_2097 [Lacticaseibacillus rhamnosus DSM 14870]EKS49469.1 hypothetical protein LRHMDP3_2304 [Lacticaseibacillus rhamnosus LRHMDP3]EKS53785.1 hypothetical protein LRHMDP2_26 [Lacticaseibacillus rhamnosus LRHMDP2]
MRHVRIMTSAATDGCLPTWQQKASNTSRYYWLIKKLFIFF